jgi:hypothetical protein
MKGAMDLQHNQYRELRKGLQVLAGREDFAVIGDFRELEIAEEGRRD